MISVLLVDDSPIVTKLVSSYLSDKGFKVEVANSSFGVSNKVKELKPEVILMDLGLPGLSGENLIALFKKRDAGFNCKVVLFSSAHEQEMKDIVARGVADDYFVKGGSLRDLEAKIRRQSEAARAKVKGGA